MAAKMANPLLILIAGGAALMLLGNKGGKTYRNKPETGTGDEPEDEVEAEAETDTEEVDQGEGPPVVGVTTTTRTFDSGTRKDRRGSHPWRVIRESDGYHAQLMISNARFSPVSEEIGITASAKAARKLLQDHFNELLIEKYPDENPKNDPFVAVTIELGHLR